MSNNDEKISETHKNQFKRIEDALVNVIQSLKISNKTRNRGEPRKIKVASGDNDTTNSESDKNVPVTGIRLPRGGWLKNPFDDLKFTGKSNSTNPVRFIKKFESIA